MSTSLVKSSKKSAIQRHLEAVERAREIYLAGIKRLEADYFDRITRATELVEAGDPETVNGQVPPQQPEPQQASAA